MWIASLPNYSFRRLLLLAAKPLSQQQQVLHKSHLRVPWHIHTSPLRSEQSERSFGTRTRGNHHHHLSADAEAGESGIGVASELF